MNYIKKSIIPFFAILFFMLLTMSLAVAQGDTTNGARMRPVEMATGLRSNGKIYVVVTVLLIILAGLIFYLVRLDRKITRLEKGAWKDT